MENFLLSVPLYYIRREDRKINHTPYNLGMVSRLEESISLSFGHLFEWGGSWVQGGGPGSVSLK